MMIRACLAFGVAMLAAPAAMAAPIVVELIGLVAPHTGDPLALPVLMDEFYLSAAALRYRVPGGARIASINSMSLFIEVGDDERGDGRDIGRVQLVLPGPNLRLYEFGPNLNSTQFPDTVELELPIDPGGFASVLAGIRDNDRFRVRVDAHRGDFYLAGGRVELDASLVPEPGSFALACAGMAFAAAVGVRRRRLHRSTAL